jgi:hypothetical protein
MPAEKQTWVSLSLLSSYKIIRTAVNSVGLLSFSCEIPDILSYLNQIWSLPNVA